MREKTRSAYSFFFHPIPLGAVALMALNDHWLKQGFPGFLTGKISDFMGVFYFPLFLCVFALLAEGLRGHHPRGSRTLIVGAILVTDLLFILAKVNVTGNAFATAVLGFFFPGSRIVMDAGDLAALLVNPLTYLFYRRSKGA